MGKSLKQLNSTKLAGIVSANIALYLALHAAGPLIQGSWGAAVSNLTKALPAGLIAALTAILNAQVSPTAKARLVFLRWGHALPGSRAFTLYADKDPRVDLEALNQSYGPFPNEPGKQNQLWYRLYVRVEDRPSVRDANSGFLLGRDCMCLLLLMSLILVPAAWLQFADHKSAAGFTLLIAAQVILCGRTAYNNGVRLVTNVLALASADVAAGKKWKISLK